MKPKFTTYTLLLAFYLLLAGCAPNQESETVADAAVPEELFSIAEFETAMTAAKSEGKLLVVDFMAEWCPPCKVMDKTTWKDPRLAALIKEKAIPVQVDVDYRPDLASKYNIEVLPTILLIDAQGNVAKQAVGFKDAKAMIDLIEEASI